MVFKKGLYRFNKDWESGTIDSPQTIIAIPIGHVCRVTGWNGDTSYFFETNINCKDYMGYIDSSYLIFMEE